VAFEHLPTLRRDPQGLTLYPYLLHDKTFSMPLYVARNAFLRTSQALSHLSRPVMRFAHTQRRTLPEFSLEGKVAVGKSFQGHPFRLHMLTLRSNWVRDFATLRTKPTTRNSPRLTNPTVHPKVSVNRFLPHSPSLEPMEPS
jgi:hypothetical protein